MIPNYILSDRYAELHQAYFGAPIFWTSARIYGAFGGSGIVVLVLLANLALLRLAQRREAFARNKAELAREKKHSDELRVQSEKLRETVSQLELTNREQAEFTYAISHDLKSPTNTMSMLIEELCGQEVATEEGRLLLADMQTTNMRMSQLVDDVLSYSRLVEEEISLEPIDLNALVGGIVEDISADIIEADAQVIYSDLPTIKGHRMQLRLLFQNLISNAIKFRKTGRNPIVEVLSETETSISVIDNGIGIPDEYREAVFGLFNRLHTLSYYEGTGLGLAICLRVMTNHGGAIAIRDGRDGGTTFELNFGA